MPVCGVPRRECPFDPLEGKTALNMAVLRHVRSIVVGNEIVAGDLTEGKGSGGRKKKRDDKQTLFQ